MKDLCQNKSASIEMLSLAHFVYNFSDITW